MPKPKRRIRFRVLVGCLLIVGALYATCCLLTSPERLRAYVQMILHEQLKGRIRLDQVNVGIFSGAEVVGLQLRSETHPELVLLHIGTLRLMPRLSSLLRGRIVIEDLVIEDPIVFAKRKPNGEWEMADIFRLKRKSAYTNLRISSIAVRNASLKLQDERAAPRSTDLLGLGGLNVVGFSAPGERGRFLLRGNIDRSLVGPCHIFGSIDLRRKVLEVVATRQALPLDSSVADALAPFLPSDLKPFTLHKGVADLKFDLVYDAAAPADIDYMSTVTLRNLHASVGPHRIPLANINGEMEVARDAVHCRGLSGVLLDGAPFTMQGTVARNPNRAKTDMTVSVENLPVSDRLRELAGPMFQPLWDQLKPSGTLGLKWTMRSRPPATEPPQRSLTVTLRNCAITPPGAPQAITDVNGIVEWAGKNIGLKNLTGRFLGAAAKVRDSLLLLDDQSPVDIQVDIPGVVIDDKFIGAMPPPQRDLLNKYRLAGKLNLVCHLRRPPGAKDFQTDILADCEDLRIAYPLLKQPFERLKGRLRLGSGAFVIERAEGFCGARPVTLTGVHIDNKHPGPISGDIVIKNWAVDDELLSFVPEHIRFIVNDLSPEGTVNVDYRILPPVNGRQSAPEMKLTILNGEARYRGFPYPVRQIQGRIIINESRVRIEGMVARSGETTFTMPDRTFDTSARDTITIEIAGKRLKLDDTLKAALSEHSQEFWDLFAPKGYINVDVRIDCIPNRKTPVVTATIQCNGAELTYQPFPYSVRNVQGTMIFTEDGVQLKGVSGEPSSGKISFADSMLYFDQTKGVSFSIKGSGLRFDSVLRSCLPKEFQSTWDTISPEGAFELDWHQVRKPGKDRKYEYNVAIRLNGCKMKYKSLPYALTKMSGELVYDGEKVSIQDVTGKYAWEVAAPGNQTRRGEAAITIRGGVSDPGAEGVVNLTVKGEDVPLDENMRQALPADYVPAWDRLQPKGNISFTCNLTYRADEKGERFIEYDVPDLHFKDCRMKVADATVSSLEGVVTLSGQVKKDPKQNWTHGELLTSSLPVAVTIDKKTYEITRLVFDDVADAVHVPYFEGWCYGGKIFGSFSVKKGAPFEDSGFTAEFRATDVDAGEVIRASGLEVKGVKGKISAESQASGKGLQLKELNAKGSLQIRKGNMGELPNLLGIPKGGAFASVRAFTDADLVYEIGDNQAKIIKADLVGAVLSLRGRGRISLDGKLALEFRPEFGPDSRKIPLIGDFVGVLVGGVIPVTLTGTLDDPHWKVDPLLPLTKLVRGIAGIFAGTPKTDKPPPPAPAPKTAVQAQPQGAGP